MRISSRRPWFGLALGCLLLTGCDLLVDAEARVGRAEERVAAGDYRAAMIELKNALQDQPDNVDARLLLSRVSLQLGELEAAQKELDRAVEAGATPQQVGVLRYDLLMAQRRFADAMTFLDTDSTLGQADRLYYSALAETGLRNLGAARPAATELRTSFPQDPRGYIALADVYAAAGETEQALAEARKALEVDPGNPIALLAEGRILLSMRRWDEAEKVLVAVTGSTKRPLDAMSQAAAYAALAEARMGRGDFEAAAVAVEELAKIAPGAPGTRVLKARLAIAAGKPADAVSELQPVVQTLPDYAAAQLLLGAALLQDRRFEQAEATLSRLVSRAPDNAEARRLLAQAQMALGRPQEAAQSLAPLDDDTSDARTDWLMGQAMMRSGSRDEAIERLERSARAQPENERLQAELAGAYIEVGRVSDAIAILEKLPEGAGDGRRESLLLLAYAAQGDRKLGRAEIEKLVAEHSDDAQLLGLAASYMRRTGDAATARQYLKQAAAAAPNDIAPLLNLSNLEYRAGDRAAAREALQRARNIDAGNEVAALGLARIALDEGSRSAAVEALDRANAANPDAVRTRLALAQLSLEGGNDDRAKQLFDEVVARSDERSAALVAVGTTQLRAKRTEEGIATLKDAVTADRNNAEAIYALGAAQVANKDTAEGRRNLEAALAKRPGWIQPAMLLTMLDVNAGRTDEALERARAARAANPDNVTAIALEADVLAAAGKIDDALAAYADAQKVRSTPQVAIRMMQLKSQRKDPQPEQPLVDHLAAHPDDILVRRALAERYQQQGKRTEAIREYERLVELAPRDAAATNNLAWLYYEEGDPRAEDTARRASEIAPDSGAITDTLGWILVEKGELEEGLAMLRRAAEQSPAIPDVRFHLAAALARSGKRAEAVSMLQELLTAESAFATRTQAETLLKELGG